MLIRHKLTILFTAIGLAIQIAFTSFVYTFYSVYREQGFTVRLQGKARLFGRVMISRHSSQGVLDRALNATDLQTLTEEHISIFDQQGKLIFTNQTPAYVQQEARYIPSLSKRSSVQFTINRNEGVGIVYQDRGLPYSIFVTGYDRLGHSKQQNLLVILLVANLGGFLLIMISGWYFVGLFLRPLANMVSRVRGVQSDAHLTLRLNEGNQTDEIAQLAMTFNQLLTQLQTTFENQRQFVSHASHELRTPLTTVLGTLETSHQYDTDPADWRISMEVAMRELTKLIDLTNSLLKLAKTSDGALAMTPIRLEECVMSAVSQVKRKRAGCTISFQFGEMPADDFFVVMGNEILLTTALQNVIDNACKYSRLAVRVDLFTQPADALHVITVTDQGIGIPLDDQPHIFEPLYRGQNAGQAEGFGVGLAITQQIIQRHRGKISLISTPATGTTVSIELPAYEARPLFLA
ncbi:HAMP domain-containing protein [Spirosoma sp. HMF3257]|uniref:histidine kinase n=1 Tax=Spirosoma telluris TaxID=2183553 RepID=A0A327NQL1_9BACT|nr:HAMP domain-containing protein [Spirosoma telluris]RAI77527.1 two-component sensor histidine kinase [Spirosoma telluris]